MDEVKTVIDSALKKLGLKTRALEYRVMELWEEVIGETITKHASVHELHRGVLFIHVDHPLWIQHLSFSSIDIKNKLNKAVGAKVVKEIRFKAGNSFNKKKTYQDVEKPVNFNYVNLTMEELRKIEGLVEDIEDPQIRKVAASLIKKGKQQYIHKKNIGWKSCPLCGVLVDQKETTCFHCKLKKIKALKAQTRAFLWELPWFNYSKISLHIEELDEDTYDNIRREMIQELWQQIRDAARNNKKVKLPKSHIQTYVMLRTALSPDKITNKIIWETLGDNIARKILGVGG